MYGCGLVNHIMPGLDEKNMMHIPFYRVNSFAREPFSGNPAGVCLLDKWLPDEMLQSIAAENNMSETAFLVPREDDYDLRWFSPAVEVDLCGHGTLASAHVIFDVVSKDAKRVTFMSKSGRLSVEKQDGLLWLDFPSLKPAPCVVPDGLETVLGVAPSNVLAARDLMVVFDDEQIVRDLKPDMEGIARLDFQGLIVTAPGSRLDFVSRFFAPSIGVPEDPVTGAAHCTLIPYWAERLNKADLHAFQLSRRGGELFCRNRSERVSIGGRAVTYCSGTITI